MTTEVMCKLKISNQYYTTIHGYTINDVNIIYESTGKIIMTQQNQNISPTYQSEIKPMVEKVICETKFSPREIEMLKHILEVVKKSHGDQFHTPPLGFENELEKIITRFDSFILQQRMEKQKNLDEEMQEKIRNLSEQLENSLKKITEMETLCQKETFEKEQFIVYCNNLNEKIVLLTNE
jgi:gas vesicle protein